jgi:hypothetical protein
MLKRKSNCICNKNLLCCAVKPNTRENELHSHVKMQTMFFYKKIWKYATHEWFWNFDTWIVHPFFWFGCVYWTPMSNSKHPMQLSKAFHKQLCLPKLPQQDFRPFKLRPRILWDEPHPHARIPMMPNNISEAKRTNKGRLTCSICCAWAWSSSHFNFAFFFTLLRGFF